MFSKFFVFRWVSFKVHQSLPEFLSGFGVAFNGEKGSGCSGTTWSFPRSETSSSSVSSLVAFSTSKGEEDGADKLPVDAVSGNSMIVHHLHFLHCCPYIQFHDFENGWSSWKMHGSLDRFFISVMHVVSYIFLINI